MPNKELNSILDSSDDTEYEISRNKELAREKRLHEITTFIVFDILIPCVISIGVSLIFKHL